MTAVGGDQKAVAPAPAEAAEPKKSVRKAKEPQAVTPEEPTSETEEAEETGLTIEDVRAEASKLTKSGKREELKAILTEMGAESLGKLKPSDYAVFLEKIKAT
jgi:hypothetical protein